MDGEADMSMYAQITTIDFITNQLKKSLEDIDGMDECVSTATHRWMKI